MKVEVTNVDFEVSFGKFEETKFSKIDSIFLFHIFQIFFLLESDDRNSILYTGPNKFWHP